MHDLKLAYLAGFFDGEGSIGIYHKKDRTAFHLRTQLTQNKNMISTELIEEFKLAFDGNISSQLSLSGRIKFNWQLNGDKAVKFLKAISPYLVLKREQAKIAIDWQKNRPPRIRNEKGQIQCQFEPDIQRSVEIAALLKKLKKGD